MPPSFDPLRRLRLRSHPVPSSSSEEDSDGSSPTESTHITLALDKSQLARKRLTSCVTSVTPVDALQPSLKPTLIRRMTSKLHISIPSRSALRSRPSTRTLPADMQGPRVAVPNNAVSRERRDAALRERGLLPPHKDFSEQERDSDKRLGSVPSPTSTACDGLSEAERLKAGWLANNRASESSDSDVEPAVVAPSYLEVLHEDPSEHAPHLPCIVTSRLEFQSSPTLVESPTSSHCPGSTLESHHASVPEKDNIRSLASRRGRKVVGSSLSSFGTRSLSNLRRSVAGSLSSTLSSADLHPHSPRTAISPTIHSIGSILRETRDIEDVESRRLSELAFLD